MNWNLPFVTRSAHQAALDEIEKLRRRVLATEARHDEVEGERRNLARMLAEADAANKRLDGSGKELRRRLDAAHDGQRAEAARATRLTVEHAARRRALAAALGDQHHLDWNQLIAEVTRMAKAAQARADDPANSTPSDEEGRLRRQVEHLQQQLDGALRGRDEGTTVRKSWGLK